MDVQIDKENITKIPIPFGSLPPIPKHLLIRRKNSQDGDLKYPKQNSRRPLSTLNGIQCEAGPSRGTTTKPSKVNVRHVTLRKQTDTLDWDYKILKDLSDDPNSSHISISDTEVDYVADDKPKWKIGGRIREINNKTFLGLVPSGISTPQVKSLEPVGVKNVKQSLKRPSSRELQGLSPMQKFHRMVKDGDERHKRRLVFASGPHKSPQTESMSTKYMVLMNKDYVEDLFAHLMSTEVKLGESRSVPSNSRACVLNWVMKIHGKKRNPAVIQTAAWYLDNILATRFVNMESLQLVTTACFWIAQKHHGCFMSAYRLVLHGKGSFSARELINTEKNVLRTLRFPPQPVVPQDYISFLCWWTSAGCCDEVEEAANFLCMAGMMVTSNLCSVYPSVVAVGSVINALQLLGKETLLTRLKQSKIYRNAKNKGDISLVITLQKKAVLLVTSPTYDYKAPYELYGVPPLNSFSSKLAKTNFDSKRFT